MFLRDVNDLCMEEKLLETFPLWSFGVPFLIAVGDNGGDVCSSMLMKSEFNYRFNGFWGKIEPREFSWPLGFRDDPGSGSDGEFDRGFRSRWGRRWGRGVWDGWEKQWDSLVNEMKEGVSLFSSPETLQSVEGSLKEQCLVWGEREAALEI